MEQKQVWSDVRTEFLFLLECECKLDDECIGSRRLGEDMVVVVGESSFAFLFGRMGVHGDIHAGCPFASGKGFDAPVDIHLVGCGR